MQSHYRLHLLFCSFNGEHPDSLRTYLQTVEPVSAPSEEHRLVVARPTLKFGSLSFTGELFHSRCSFGGAVGHCPRVLLVLIFLSSLSLRLFILSFSLEVKPF